MWWYFITELEVQGLTVFSLAMILICTSAASAVIGWWDCMSWLEPLHLSSFSSFLLLMFKHLATNCFWFSVEVSFLLVHSFNIITMIKYYQHFSTLLAVKHLLHLLKQVKYSRIVYLTVSLLKIGKAYLIFNSWSILINVHVHNTNYQCDPGAVVKLSERAVLTLTSVAAVRILDRMTRAKPSRL